MPTLWGVQEPGIERPGGYAWWAEVISQAVARLYKMEANLTGQQPVSGTLAAQMKPMSASLLGVEHPKGTIAASMQQAVASAVGGQRQVGTLAATSQKLAASLVGAMHPAGTISSQMRAMSSSLLAEQIYQAAIAASLKPMGASLNAIQGQVALLSSSLPKMSASLIGVMQPAGVVAAQMKPMSASLGGEVGQRGNLAAALKALSATLNGEQRQQGSVAAGMVKMGASMSGAQMQAGVLASSLGKPSAQLLGVQHPRGAIASSLQKPAAALAGEKRDAGVIAASLQKPAAALAGTQRQSGAIGSSFGKASALLAGAQAQQGALASALAKAIATLAGEQAAAATGVEYIGVVGSYDGATGTAVNFTCNATAGDFVLIATSNNSTHNPTSMTYGGRPMKRLNGQNIAAIGRVDGYYLENAPGGTQTVQTTWTANVTAEIRALAWRNVTLVKPVAANNTASQTFSGLAADEVAVGIFGSTNAINLASGGTARYDGTLLVVGESSANTTMTASGGTWNASTGLILSPITVPISYSAVSANLSYGGSNGGSGNITTTTAYETVLLFSTASGGQSTAPTLAGVPMDFVGNLVPLDGGMEMDVFMGVAPVAGSQAIAFDTVPTNAWGTAYAIAMKGIPLRTHEIQTALGASANPSLAAVMDGADHLVHAMSDFSSQISSTSGGTSRATYSSSTASGSIAIADSASAVTFAETLNGASTWFSVAVPLSDYPPAKVRHRATGIGLATADSKTTSGSFGLWTAPGDYLIVDIMGDDAGSAVTYDGVALTLLGSFQSGTGSANQQLTSFQRFGGFVAPLNAGFKTLAWTGSSPVGACRLNVVTYSGVVSVGTTTHAFGSGGTPAITRTCAAGEKIVAGFGSNQAGAAWAASGGKVRFNPAVTVMPMAFMDSDASATFQVAAASIGSWNAFTTLLKIT